MNSPGLNLILDPWLPILRRSGKREWIAPGDLTTKLQTDPVMSLAWSRPEFNLAGYEFLVGLLSSATPPADERHWKAWEESPPAPETLLEALQPLARRFELTGVGIRFAQDRELLERDSGLERRPAERLLLNAPGKATQRKGTDIFVGASVDAVLSLPAAAMALYAHQQYAGSGGAGYRTALRGGGPWVIRVLGREEDAARALWHGIWGNVESHDGQMRRGADRREGGSRFPWEAATRLSKDRKAPLIRQGDVHPQIVFWATPRRIRLTFVQAHGRRCAVTGREDPWVVDGFYSTGHGANYESSEFRHPLTPHYRQGKKKVLPMHPQPGGLTLQNWARICTRAYTDTSVPAAVLETWRERVKGSPAPVILRVQLAGLDIESAKCRSWISAEVPVVAFARRGVEEAFNEAVAGWIEAVQMTARQLASSLARARYGDSDRRSIEKIDAEGLRQQVNRAAAAVFFAQLPALVRTPRRRARPAALFLSRLAETAVEIFERESSWRSCDDLLSYANARFSLWLLLSGKGGSGQKLYRLLGVPEPDPEADEIMTSPKTTSPWHDKQTLADVKRCLSWWKAANKRGNQEGIEGMQDLSRARSLSEIENHAEALKLISICPSQPREQLLIVAGVLSAVHVHKSEKRVARQVGQTGLNVPARGVLTPQALRVLLSTQPGKLLTPLRELVRATRRRINIFDLACLILSWGRREVRRRFLYDYYGVVAMQNRPIDYALGAVEADDGAA